MSEKNLTQDEVIGAASAAMRGAAFVNFLDTAKAEAARAREAFDDLDQALEDANQARDKAGLDAGTLPEDRAVVDAAKNYARAETEWLRTLEQYLQVAQCFEFDTLMNSGGESGSGASAFDDAFEAFVHGLLNGEK